MKKHYLSFEKPLKDLDFEISGVYSVIPTGSAEDSHTPEQDFFEVDLIEDWGKSEKKNYTLLGRGWLE